MRNRSREYLRIQRSTHPPHREEEERLTRRDPAPRTADCTSSPESFPGAGTASGFPSHPCPLFQSGPKSEPSALYRLDALVHEVERQCIAYCVPSFTAKTETARKIEELKYEISLGISRAKADMDAFMRAQGSTLDRSVLASIGTHFNYKLEIMVSRINASLGRIEAGRLPTEQEADRGSASASAESVYKSVHFISRIIAELKSLVVSQTDKIERLDMAMDKIAHGSSQTAKEISSISTFGSHVKNRIITVLFCSIMVLIVLSTLKTATSR